MTTFVASYPSATRGKPHETARLHCGTCWCGCVAACGAGATAGAHAHIGCLIPGSQDSHGLFVAAFQRRLGQLGYVEGQDFVLDLRWAEGKIDRFPAFARELRSWRLTLLWPPSPPRPSRRCRAFETSRRREF